MSNLRNIYIISMYSCIMRSGDLNRQETKASKGIEIEESMGRNGSSYTVLSYKSFKEFILENYLCGCRTDGVRYEDI